MLDVADERSRGQRAEHVRLRFDRREGRRPTEKGTNRRGPGEMRVGNRRRRPLGWVTVAEPSVGDYSTVATTTSWLPYSRARLGTSPNVLYRIRNSPLPPGSRVLGDARPDRMPMTESVSS